jgi:hypothetical protein
MIRLTAIGEQNPAELVATEPVFRITGAAVWVPHRISRGTPLAHFSGRLWHYDGRIWSGLRFDGPCRLTFGLPRDPAGSSDELSGISIHGTSLIANGLPLAVYEPDKDVWHGANRWWQAFRIEYVAISKGVIAWEVKTGQPASPEDPHQARAINAGRSRVLIVRPTLLFASRSPVARPDSDSRAQAN